MQPHFTSCMMASGVGGRDVITDTGALPVPVDGVSISQGDPKIRMHGKECYCGLEVSRSRSSL